MKKSFLLLILFIIPSVLASQIITLTGFSVKAQQSVNVGDKDVIYFDVGNDNSVMVNNVGKDSVDLVLYPFLSYSSDVTLTKTSPVRLNLDSGAVLIKLDNINNGMAILDFGVANTDKNNTITSQAVYLPKEEPSATKTIIAGAVVVLLFALILLIFRNKKNDVGYYERKNRLSK